LFMNVGGYLVVKKFHTILKNPVILSKYFMVFSGNFFMTNSPKKLFLIDGSHLAYRAYFAFIRRPLINSKGENTSATFGFTQSLLKILSEEKPDYIAVVFDTPEPTFRHKEYPEYKATREKMPDEMSDQLPRIRQVIETLGLPIIEVPGYEADDVMATLAKRAKERRIETYLVTGDKDFFQLVDDSIKIYRPRHMGDSVDIVDREWLEKNWGIRPDQVVDYLAIVGDKIDNIPGIKGLGEQAAKELIRKYGSLEKILESLDELPKKRWKTAVENYGQDGILSKRLVTIDSNAPVDSDIEALKQKDGNPDEIINLFKDLEFKKLMDRYFSNKKKLKQHYQIIDSADKLERFVSQLKAAGNFVFDLETTNIDPLRSHVVGFSFAWIEGEAYYIPVAAGEKETASALGPLFQSAEVAAPSENQRELPLKLVVDRLKPILEDQAIKKCGQNIKYDMLALTRYQIRVEGVDFDTMVASYLINPSSHQHNLDSLSFEYLNYTKVPTSDLIGKGKNQRTMREVAVEKVAFYACEDADMTLRLRNILEPKLKDAELYDLFEQVEIPLISVLMTVEKNGVALDTALLRDLSVRVGKQLEQLEKEIFDLAGEQFNINSPKQLGKILFEKLNLPKARRTKTGYSTDVSVLEELAKIHPLPQKLLDYRGLAKLKSTYIDALPKLINPETGRVHTSYNQTVAATGRLSSSDPNLQNIPIRTELGREIRKAFIPGNPNHVILDADYSQIELRIMAHLSGDENLLRTFENDEDVHTATAALVFGVEPEEVTPDLRRRAKEINFGIMYGMGPYGLASRLDISTEEARQFIINYFAKYPGVQEFIRQTIEQARQKGYVTTLLNRRRYLPEIRSDNRRMREFAERTAVNTPIQGTAADLIKVAMIHIHNRLKKEGLKSLMIMQVHDELVFEVPESEIERMKKMVREEMEGAIELTVPIKVDMGVGANWLEAH